MLAAARGGRGARRITTHLLGGLSAIAPAGTGIAIRLGASFALTRFMPGLLYRVSVTDAATLVAGPAVFVAVALAASYLPAGRAMGVGLAIAMRSE